MADMKTGAPTEQDGSAPGSAAEVAESLARRAGFAARALDRVPRAAEAWAGTGLDQPSWRREKARGGGTGEELQIIVSAGEPQEVGGLERLALAAGAPVLVLREPERVLRWMRGGATLRVLCAHDLSSVASEALRFVGRLMAVGRCRTTVAHAHRGLGEATHAGCGGVGAKQERDREVRVELTRRLEAEARRVLGAESVQVSVSAAPFQRGSYLLELMAEGDPDLAVVPVHPSADSEDEGRGGLATTLLRCTRGNLVLVPAAYVRVPWTPPQIRRALVVLDQGSGDEAAILQAKSLLAIGGTLRLLQVVVPPRGNESPEAALYPGRWTEICRNRLHVLALRTQARDGVSVDAEVVVERNRARAIATAAEQFQADIVCVAWRERPGRCARFFGTALERLLKASKRPLLLVRDVA